MKLEAKKHLFDMQVAIESVEDYLRGTNNFPEYQKNKLLRRAVEREIEIIGEAMKRLLAIAPEIRIENARQIVDTRN